MTVNAVPKPPKREKKPPKGLQRSQWGVSSKPRKPLAVRGKQKTKREKAYHKHLSSKYWVTLRWLAWQRDNGMCTAQVCMHPTRTILGLRDMQLAHRTYKRFGAEHLSDVGCEHPECNLAERQSRAWYAGRIA